MLLMFLIELLKLLNYILWIQTYEFMTIHQAKGLEFKKVIIPGMEDGILPSAKVKTPLQIEYEEA